MMTAIVGWIAFGPGPRRFSTTISLPFMTQSWMSGELSGRVAFGVAAMLLAAMFVGCGAVGIERLRRAGRG